MEKKSKYEYRPSSARTGVSGRVRRHRDIPDAISPTARKDRVRF
jgi:hypothetical protein